MRLRYALRESHENDAPFVRSSWTTSYYQHNIYLHALTPWDLYYNAQCKAIDKIMMAGGKLLVAVNPEDLNQIYGWVCYQLMDSTAVIHYVYIKDWCRRNGLATAMLRKLGVNPYEPIMITHAVKALVTRHYSNAKSDKPKWECILINQLSELLNEKNY